MEFSRLFKAFSLWLVNLSLVLELAPEILRWLEFTVMCPKGLDFLLDLLSWTLTSSQLGEKPLSLLPNPSPETRALPVSPSPSSPLWSWVKLHLQPAGFCLPVLGPWVELLSIWVFTSLLPEEPSVDLSSPFPTRNQQQLLHTLNFSFQFFLSPATLIISGRLFLSFPSLSSIFTVDQWNIPQQLRESS